VKRSETKNLLTFHENGWRSFVTLRFTQDDMENGYTHDDMENGYTHDDAHNDKGNGFIHGTRKWLRSE
jgi:hypothetical protein